LPIFGGTMSHNLLHDTAICAFFLALFIWLLVF
jgi:hypothetical protein